MINDEIVSLLNHKFEENNLSKKTFAALSKISYPAICNLMSGSITHPELRTIIKIADYFSCSIDAVIGRKNKYPDPDTSTVIRISDYNKAMDTLRAYLNREVENNKLRIHTLGKNLGFSTGAVSNFIRGKSNHKSLWIAVIVAIADYFDVSVDEMIGRVSSSKLEQQH